MITESECPSYDYYIYLMLLFTSNIYNICVENVFPPSLRACELIYFALIVYVMAAGELSKLVKLVRGTYSLLLLLTAG